MHYNVIDIDNIIISSPVSFDSDAVTLNCTCIVKNWGYLRFGFNLNLLGITENGPLFQTFMDVEIGAALRDVYELSGGSNIHIAGNLAYDYVKTGSSTKAQIFTPTGFVQLSDLMALHGTRTNTP